MERESLKNILARWRGGATSFLPPPGSLSPGKKSISPTTSPSSTPTKRGTKKKSRTEPVTLSQQVGAATTTARQPVHPQHTELDDFEMDRMFLTSYNVSLVAPPSARLPAATSSASPGSPVAGQFRKSIRSKQEPPQAATSTTTATAAHDEAPDLTPVAAFDTGYKGSVAFPSISSYRRLVSNDAETSDTAPQSGVHSQRGHMKAEPSHIEAAADEDDFDVAPPPSNRPSRSADDFFDAFASFAPPISSNKNSVIIEGTSSTSVKAPPPAPQKQQYPTIADMLDDGPPPPSHHHPQLTPTCMFPLEWADPAVRQEGANRMSSLMDMDEGTAFHPQHHVDMFVSGARPSIGPINTSSLSTSAKRNQIIPHQLGSNATAAAAIKDLNDAFADWSLQLGDNNNCIDNASPSQHGGAHGIEVIQEADILSGMKATEAHKRFDIIFEVQVAESSMVAPDASPGSGSTGPSLKCSHAHKMVLLTCTVHSLGHQLSTMVLGRNTANKAGGSTKAVGVGDEEEDDDVETMEMVPANKIVHVSKTSTKERSTKEYYMPQGNNHPNDEGDTLGAQPSRMLAKSQIARNRQTNTQAEEEGLISDSMQRLVDNCGALLECTILTSEDSPLPTFQVLMSDQLFYTSGLQQSVRTYGLRHGSSSGRMSQQHGPNRMGGVLFGVGFHIDTPNQLCVLQVSVNVRAIRVKAELGHSSGGLTAQSRPFRFDDPLAAANDADVRRNLFEEGLPAVFDPLSHIDDSTGFAFGPYPLATADEVSQDDWFVSMDVIGHIYGVYQQLLDDEQQQ